MKKTRPCILNNGKMGHISDLLPEMMIEIISRLPVRTIISCKCVCKKWLTLISSSEFAKLHLSRSTPVLVIRKLREPPTRMFETDTADLLSDDLHCRPMMKFDPNLFSGSPKSKTFAISSIDGLLFLHDINSSNTDYEVFYVCNPITREYAPLPLLSRYVNGVSMSDPVAYGIGKSRLNGQYKVVRIFHELISIPGSPRDSVLRTRFMVHTLGTDSWRGNRINENDVYDYGNGAFLNGNLHWVVAGLKEQQISSFDLEYELFKPFSPPIQNIPLSLLSLTVLENCLCFCNTIKGKEFDIWIMNEYGVEESWTKKFVFSYADVPRGGPFDHNILRILTVLKNGDILMFKACSFPVIHCKKTKANRKVHVVGRESSDSNWMMAVLHTPSFISLKSYGFENVCSFEDLKSYSADDAAS